jgi:predicted DNA-binding transcriptional regulator YafY
MAAMATMNLYRSQFRRLMELDQRIRAGDYPNCFTFADAWEVSRKTVQRDIQFLKDGMGAPLAYDYERRGYYYTDMSWSLPGLTVTEGELLQLLLAERMAAQYQGTPIAKTIESLFEKIREALPDRLTVNPAYVSAQFSFHGQPKRPISEDVWLPIFQALRGSRVLRIWYKAVDWRRAHTRDLEPVHLACIAEEWYLIAYDRGVKELRNFAVSRIQSVESGDEVFEGHEFDPEAYFANRFGRFVGKAGEAHRIAVLFGKDVAAWVAERVWHPEQRIRRHRDGTLTLSFPAPSLYEVKRWVLQWGAEAEVLEPEELRDAVRKDVEGLRSRYRTGDCSEG